MLIHQYPISVRVHHHERCRAGGRLVRLGHEPYALRPESPLDLADVGVPRHRLRVRVPAGVECQDVALEHPLEEAEDGVGAVLHDQPVLRRLIEEDGEAELLVEGAGRGEVLDREADGKVAELHGVRAPGRDGCSQATAGSAARRFRLSTPAATRENRSPTGSGSRNVNAMLASGFSYISLNSAI